MWKACTKNTFKPRTSFAHWSPKVSLSYFQWLPFRFIPWRITIYKNSTFSYLAVIFNIRDRVSADFGRNLVNCSSHIPNEFFLHFYMATSVCLFLKFFFIVFDRNVTIMCTKIYTVRLSYCHRFLNDRNTRNIFEEPLLRPISHGLHWIQAMMLSTFGSWPNWNEPPDRCTCENSATEIYTNI